MDTAEDRIEKQVQFWSMIGPFLILMSVGVLLFKMSAHWYFPLSAIIGIPLCVKWKMKGMAAALAFLFAFSILAYRSVDIDEQYWHVGMALSMAFSLIVLTLALEEVEGLMGNIRRESQSRLDNFVTLDESLKTSESAWTKEKELLQNQIDILTQSNIKVTEEKQTFFKLAHLAKDELTQLHDQHQLLLEELIYKKQSIAELNERIEETELTIHELVHSENGQKIKHLTAQLDSLSNQVTEHQHEKERLHIAIVRSQDQCHAIREMETRQKHLIEDQLVRINELRNTLVEKENQAYHIQRLNEDLRLRLAHETEQNKIRQQELLDQTYAAKEELKNHQIAFTHTSLATEQHMREQSMQHQAELNHAMETLKHSQERAQNLEDRLKSALENYEQNQLYKERQIALEFENTEARKALEVSESQVRLLEARLAEFIEIEKQNKEQKDMLLHTLHATNEEIRENGELLLAQFNEVKANNERIQHSLQETELKLKLAESKLKNIQENQSKLPASDNTRRIESMYVQLKSQFEEKTETLEMTRHALFVAQEKIEEFKRNYDEEKIYGVSQNESLLEKDINRLTQELEALEKIYLSETSELQDIIELLSRS